MLYLCGPINGCTDDEAANWRELVKNWIGEESCIDPMRRDFRGIEGDHTKEIVEGDLEDIRRSRVVLANCWQPSFGTPMEIFYAHSQGKPVIAVVPSLTAVSPWLKYHAQVFDKLQGAVHYYRALRWAMGWSA